MKRTSDAESRPYSVLRKDEMGVESGGEVNQHCKKGTEGAEKE